MFGDQYRHRGDHRALVTLVPHTTSMRGSRFEVTTKIKFLRPGAFDVQNLMTVPAVKFRRLLGRLSAPEMAVVETALRSGWSLNVGVSPIEESEIAAVRRIRHEISAECNHGVEHVDRRRSGPCHDLINRVPLPPKAEIDALHIAITAVHGIDYLLTWNCTHIANAALQHRIAPFVAIGGSILQRFVHRNS